MADIIINKPEAKSVGISRSTQRTVSISPATGGGGGGVKLTPTVEIDGSAVLFHYVTLEQMEKMHIRIEGTDTGMLGFTLTKGEDDFELRFSADSPQAFAGELVIDDSIDIVDYVFGNLLVELPIGYEVKFVIIDGVDANLLEADINWRLADIQKRIGEGGGSQALEQFFGLDGVSRGYTAATAAEIITLNNELLAEAWPECPVSGPTYVDDTSTDTRYYADGTVVTPIPES